MELNTLMEAASALVEQVLKLLHPLWGCQAHQGSIKGRICGQICSREHSSKGGEEDRAVGLSLRQSFQQRIAIGRNSDVVQDCRSPREVEGTLKHDVPGVFHRRTTPTGEVGGAASFRTFCCTVDQPGANALE